MATFSSNIVSGMKIISPDDDSCTYSSCTITPDTGTNYLSIVSNAVTACFQPKVLSPPC